jgi:hypothetical protein
MNKHLLSTLIFIFGLAVLFTSCKNDSEDPAPSYTLTQDALNNSTGEVEMNVTGKKYGEDVSIPHGGSGLTFNDTYRDIYTSTAKSTSASSAGTVFTKRTYVKNADGSKGDLLVTFAMAKREAGYYSDGGDWEYVMMPNDGSNDYTANPNGMLPAEGSDMRGQLANCAGCHSQAGTDFIFSEGDVPVFKATQADLDRSTNVEDLDVTGTEYGDAAKGHNGTPDPNSTFRDIYSNILEKESVDVGTILTKGTFIKNVDGSKGALQVTFAMIKREPGYYPEGGDWEYVMMPNDGTNDYEMHPNGTLPAEGSENRGKLPNCAGCHAEAGSSFSFVRSN